MTGFGFLVSGARHIVAALVAVLLVSCAMSAQAARALIPDGWVVSPSNTKTAGEAGYCIRHKEMGMELLYIPASTYLMGTTEAEGQCAVKEFKAYPERMATEQPAHEVELSGYWIGRTEVTAGQWRKVMEKMPPPDDTKRDRNNNGDDHPVTWGCAASL